MEPDTTIMVEVSMVGLLLVSAIWARRSGEWRMFIALALGLAIFSFFLNRVFGFPQSQIISMGAGSQAVLWVALYICMLVGMFAQFAYRHLVRPQRQRRKWDWGLFIAPVFASPIVFIPLATSCLSAGLDPERITSVRLMIFLVAFQNGFFWKEFFDLKQKEGNQEK